MSITFVRDATHRNINAIPAGMLAALYTTGSVDIKATAEDFRKHPNAVRICQDHGSDITADILDMENRAATPSDCAIWIPKARHSFVTNARPGQRWPGIYCSLSRITEVANVFVNAKITNVPLWIAEWGLAQNLAINNIEARNGPFPTIAFQIRNDMTTDFNVFSTEWLNKKSGAIVAVKPTPPPGQWDDPDFWEWRDAVITGIGLDGRQHTFTYNAGTGQWLKVD